MVNTRVAAAVLALTPIALAQDGADPRVAMVAAMTPGAQHADLAKGAGQWHVETRVMMPGMEQVPPSFGRATAQMILGGRFLEVDQSGSMLGMTTGSKVLLGYDNTRRQHFALALQTLSTGPMISWGSQQKDGSVEFEGTIYEHPTPEGRPFRHTMRWLNDDTFRIDVFDWIDETWVQVVEEIHRRRHSLVDLDLWNASRLEDRGDGSASWSIEDGVLKCTGAPKGELRTRETFTNFELEFEWRWPGEGGNSGLLIHSGEAPGPIGGWPKCLEVQLRSGQAGWFFMLGESISVAGAETRTRGIGIRRLETAAPVERPLGEWNHMRVRCVDGTVRVWVNGAEVNAGGDCTAKSGAVCLQSEGTEIHFRNIGVVRGLSPR